MANEEKIALAKLKLIEQITNAADKRIMATMDKLEKLVIERITEADISGRVDAALALQAAQKLLQESGYYVEVGRLLNDDYQRILEESYEGYKLMFDEAFQFSEESLAKLDAMKQLDFNQFNQLGQKSAESLSRGIVDLQFGAVTRKQMLEQFEKAIETNKGYINTWVNTGLSGYYTQSNVLLAEDAGMDRFKYVGNINPNTRPFCRKHINEVRTIAGWNSLNKEQGQIAPVSIWRGGYNCVHALVATDAPERIN
jgi:hypothetical protein